MYKAKIARYILGSIREAPEFNKNYIKGWRAATHNQGGSDADEATFDCPR